MTQINSSNVNVPGQHQRRVNELDTDRNEYNGVDIMNPF
jgi:hypothetical protein